ncbi:39S ribosomal protein L33, mitochondrial [Blyttiomyces sp. JEL0837]|nr:39S ribosomal protein L33, mitochondrial [Blyttiomyces sp. JEL0837]
MPRAPGLRGPTVRRPSPPSDAQLKMPVSASTASDSTTTTTTASTDHRKSHQTSLPSKSSLIEAEGRDITLEAFAARVDFRSKLKERENKPKRHLTDSQTGLPLPTTFADPNMNIEKYKKLHRSRLRDITHSVLPEPLPVSDKNPYPYKYYQITLRRSLFGIPKQTRRVVEVLGLKDRHEVVWQPVNPKIAGNILKVKELVDVKLVNEIPPKPSVVLGYTRVNARQ